MNTETTNQQFGKPKNYEVVEYPTSTGGKGMRKLGDQWIEEIDGVRHMLKAVDSTYNCNGCTFLSDSGKCLHSSIFECPVYRIDAIIKDLGPVNEDGFLREERSGQYPDISHDKRNGVYEAYLHATLINPAMSAVLVRVQASSMDRLKEAWNRRA